LRGRFGSSSSSLPVLSSAELSELESLVVEESELESELLDSSLPETSTERLSMPRIFGG